MARIASNNACRSSPDLARSASTSCIRCAALLSRAETAYFGCAEQPLRDELYELIRELEPVAERMGCTDDLCVVSDVLE